MSLLAATVTLPCAAATTRLYQLAQGSTFTASERGPALPARGSFRMVRQLSPLDWESYELEHARIVVQPGEPTSTVWRGSGRFSIGGRGPYRQQLILELTDGTHAVRFDSGAVPADGRWPELDLTLAGDAPSKPSLRVHAVPELARWHYRTLAGTLFLDDCAICDRLSIPVPVSGAFDLVHTGSDPLFEHYRVFNLRLTDGTEKPAIEVTGEGTLDLGGEVALQQKWNLQLEVRTPANTRIATLSTEDSKVQRLWPMLSANVVEKDGTDLSRFFLDLNAAPLRELWFNTVHGLTSGLGSWPDNRISEADILNDLGRIITPGAPLLKRAGLPIDSGLDAFDVLPGSGGTIAFSTLQPATSPSLGTVSEGDLLTSHGAVLKRNRELLAAFGFMPPTPDLGLDAVFRLSPTEYLFSVRTSAFSETLGTRIGPGDLLSSTGKIVRSGPDLLARFKPAELLDDPGLDAFFVWPSGEIWFSLETGFQDANHGFVTDGDLLSDHGYIVHRNLDLVRAFQPLEDLANFGLQGLLVISDASPTSPEGAPELKTPRCSSPTLTLTWHGPGRVFQVLATSRLDDPFLPVSEIRPAIEWTTSWEAAPDGQSHYTVRSW